MQHILVKSCGFCRFMLEYVFFKHFKPKKKNRNNNHIRKKSFKIICRLELRVTKHKEILFTGLFLGLYFCDIYLHANQKKIV